MKTWACSGGSSVYKLDFTSGYITKLGTVKPPTFHYLIKFPKNFETWQPDKGRPKGQMCFMSAIISFQSLSRQTQTPCWGPVLIRKKFVFWAQACGSALMPHNKKVSGLNPGWGASVMSLTLFEWIIECGLKSRVLAVSCLLQSSQRMWLKGELTIKIIKLSND